MNIKVEVKNLEKLTAAFQRAPDAVKNQMRLALRVSLRNIQRRARSEHRFRTRTGNLERSIDTQVLTDWPPSGRVLIDPAITKTADGRSYGVMQHNGTPDHRVKPKHKKALRWPVSGGFAFSRGHTVRGIKADPFLYKAGEHERAEINNIFSRYADAAIKGAGL